MAQSSGKLENGIFSIPDIVMTDFWNCLMTFPPCQRNSYNALHFFTTGSTAWKWHWH